MYRKNGGGSTRSKEKRQQHPAGIGGLISRALWVVGVQVGLDHARWIGAVVCIVALFIAHLMSGGNKIDEGRTADTSIKPLRAEYAPDWTPAVALDMSGEECFGTVFNGEWELSGTTRSGKPWYKRDTGTKPRRFAYMYFDPDCDGPDQHVGQQAWVVSASRPNIEVESDLDEDGICNIAAWVTVNPASLYPPKSPPSGPWKISCHGVWETTVLQIRGVDKVTSDLFQGWMSVLERARKMKPPGLTETALLGLPSSLSTAWSSSDSSDPTSITEDELIQVLAAVLRMPTYAHAVLTEMQQVAIGDIIAEYPDLMDNIVTKEEQQVLAIVFSHAQFTFGTSAVIAAHSMAEVAERLKGEDQSTGILMELCEQDENCAAKRLKGWITSGHDVLAAMVISPKGKEAIITLDEIFISNAEKIKKMEEEATKEQASEDTSGIRPFDHKDPGSKEHDGPVYMAPDRLEHPVAEGDIPTHLRTVKVPGNAYLYVDATAKELRDVKAQLTNMLKQDDYLEGDEWYEENQVGDDDEANGGAGGIGDTNWF